MSLRLSAPVLLLATSAFAAVHGKVTLAGAPKNPDVAIRVGVSDPACTRMGKVMTENWKIGEGNGLADAVVWVLDAPPARPVGTETIVQKGCRYVPHVLCIAKGATVTFRNDDPTLHNIHASEYRGKAENAVELFNAGQTEGMATNEVFNHAGIFKIRCDVHPWMEGWILVTDGCCFAVTGADGSFQLPALPDGNYTAQAWHSGFEKPLTHKFTVKGGNAILDLEFNAAQAD